MQGIWKISSSTALTAELRRAVSSVLFLANIYLDQFDKCILEYKKKFDKGAKRAYCKDYQKLAWKRHSLVEKVGKCTDEAERSKIIVQIKELDRRHRQMPCTDPMDSNFRRLQYVRYADDFLIGIIGSKADAAAVKNRHRRLHSKYA
jgi:Reverse transcriptase (RNA-dependent DNA polymerase).